MSKLTSAFIVFLLVTLASCQSFKTLDSEGERTARSSKGRLLHIPPEIKEEDTCL